MSYQKTDITGESWRRCHTVQVSNQLNQDKVITFLEEVVYSLSDGASMKQYVDGCKTMFDANQSFALLDQAGNPTGQFMTHAQLYQALSSLYVDTAAKRDNAGV